MLETGCWKLPFKTIFCLSRPLWTKFRVKLPFALQLRDIMTAVSKYVLYAACLSPFHTHPHLDFFFWSSKIQCVLPEIGFFSFCVLDWLTYILEVNLLPELPDCKRKGTWSCETEFAHQMLAGDRRRDGAVRNVCFQTFTATNSQQ